MTKILNALRREHVQISLILRALETQLNAVRSRKGADFRTLHPSATFIADFLSNVHHPREERVLKSFAKRSPEMGHAVDLLCEEHRQCESHAKRFVTSVERTQRNCHEPGESFTTQLEELIDRQRIFMRFEEKTMFPMVDRVLSTRDFLRLEEADAQVDDHTASPTVTKGAQNTGCAWIRLRAAPCSP